MNREEWLTELARKVEHIFNFRGWKAGNYRISCGWPISGGNGRRRRVVGLCHAAKISEAGVHEIFISPALGDSLEVAGTTCHELAHSVVGVEEQHGAKFKMICRVAGITKGKAIEAMPGDALNDKLRRYIEELGEYPHKPLVPILKPVKASSTVRLECPDCGCKASIGAKWIEESGIPTCGCGADFLVP